MIPGATITLVSETRGITFEAQSNEAGDFVFSSVPGDTYTVRISMDGFRTSERKGVAASPGDRVAVPPMTIEVGELTETVLVTGDAPMIQAQTGERSFTVAKEQVESLPIALRYFGQFATLAPGVISTGTNRFARLDGARTNYMLDGISSVNTGGNQPGLELNADAIAEVKVVSSAYQAEYGRSTGIQISGVTKSGIQPVPRIVLRHRAKLRLELEQLGQRAERQRQSGREGTGLGLHDRRPGRQAGRQQQDLLLLLRAVFAAHDRRSGQSLSCADAARASGRLLADNRQQRRGVQSDS